MNRFLQIIFFTFLLAISNLLSAQSSVRNYTFSSAAGTYTPISGTNSTAAGDEGVENGIPIGFNFFYGGYGLTHFCVTTNGFIKIGIGSTTISSGSNANGFINSAGTSFFPPLIAAFWDNNNRNNGTISYLTTGAAGSRVLTVQWDGVNVGGNGATSTASTASFQIKLFEGTNVVKIIYSNTLASAGTTSATIGLNDETTYLSVTPATTATVSSTASNNAVSDLTNLRGMEYTFTPAAPLCTPVSSMTVTNITSSTALVTVNTVSGAAGYRYAVNTTSAYPASSTLTTTPTYTLTGLLPNTTYYAKVACSCTGIGISGWYTTSFTTSCATLTLPYFQNFDSAVVPSLPTCMSAQDLNAGTSWATSAAGSYSSPNSMQYVADPAVPGNDWFYTAPVALTSGTTYRLTYYYKNSSPIKAEKLEVKYGNASNAAAMTNSILRDTNILNTNYSVREQDFTATATGAFFVGFHNFSNANQVALNIDDIRIQVRPTCGVPTLLNVSMSSSSAGIASWTAPTTGTVTSYQYAISTSATAPASGTTVSTTSVNINGLTAGQLYYLHVRTVCSTASAWSSFPFRAPCNVLQVPYFENFDTSVTVPALKNCYTAQDLNGGAHWETSTAYYRSAPNSMVYNYDESLPGNDWFFTPAIRLTGGVTYKISYYNRAGFSSTPERLEVKYGTANNATAMTNLITTDSNITSTTYLLSAKNFTPAATGDYYIGFHEFSIANQYTLSVDDISIDVSADCGVPTNLAVVTNTASSGTVSWSAPVAGTVSSYQYAVSSSATPPASGTTVTATAGSFSGLQAVTQYYLHVKSSCAAGTFSGWSTLAFTTPCAALNVPYTENFNTPIVPALPGCMTKIDVNGGNSWGTDSFASCTPTKALLYKDNSLLPGDDWAITPGLNLTAGVRYELNFNYKACTNSYQERLEVKYGNANTVSAMGNLLYSNTTINQTTYQPARASFIPTVSGVYYIGFHVTSPANQYNLYVDDIKVDVSSFCGQPTNPSVNFTGNAAGTVKWSRPLEGSPATYQYSISTSNIPPVSGTVIADTVAAFSGLQTSTRYFLHVRTTCSDGNFSNWTTYSFTTACFARTIPYTENFDNVPKPYLGNCMTIQDINGGTTWTSDSIKPRSAPNAMIYHYSTDLPANDWAYTPGLILEANIKYRLSFYYKGRSDAYRERLDVKYGNAATADSMFTILYSNIIGDTTYQLAQIDFTAPSSSVFYIGFHATSGANQWDLNIDDIKVDYAPGCGLPRSLNAVVTSDSTATATWSAPLNGPAAGYEFDITNSPTPPSSGIPTTGQAVQFSGLVQGINYYVHVRTACSGGVYSTNWVTDTFYIPCNARNVPYTQNFDAVTAPALPPCITKEDLNAGTTWNNSTVIPRSAPNCMVYRYSSTLPGNDWFYTAPLNLTAGTTYRLVFYYKGRTSGSTEKLEVKFGTGNNAASMVNAIFADTSITSTAYLQSATDFTPSATGVYYIGFHAFSKANQFDLSVDDIRLDIAPNCQKPTQLTVTPTSNTGGTATWNGGSLSAYEYVVDSSPALPEAGTSTNSNSAFLTGLTPAQQYYLHVRKICSGDQFSLWSSIPFTIPCSPYAIPYFQSFDSTNYNTLPPCMSSENINGGNTWITNELASYSSPFSVYYVAEADRAANDWLYTPELSLTAGVSYRLSFYYKAQSPDRTEKMEVKYGIANNAAAMTNLLMSDTTINFTEFRLYRFDFVPSATRTYYIGFHAMSNKNQSLLFVDDIKIDRSPNCSNPVNLAAHLSNGNGGTITWSPSTPGIPTGYEYVVNTSSADPAGAGIATADSFINISSLNLSLFTQYYAHVRTVCTNGISTWFTIAFNTLPNDEPCNALTLTPNGPQSCGNTAAATMPHDPALPSGCNPPNFTVWYKFTPPVSGAVIIRTVIPSTNYPLYGSIGWYTLSGNCGDAAAYTLVPNSTCQSFGSGGPGDTDSLLSPILTAGTTYYIMLGGIDYNTGDYCVNIISAQAPHTYRFTGSGTWSDSFNWENQNIPPAVLPPGDVIIIDNTAGGQCVLDITQRISTTASLIINAGKKLIIPGVLNIQ